MNAGRTWGSRAEERARPYPCDEVLGRRDLELWRGITVEAAPPILFRWLCQLKVAPYSYDWIDNLGRRSPRHLVPGVERLAVGQRVMTIFRLVAFATDRHLTIRTVPGSWGERLFGAIACTYRVEAEAPRRCRLLVKLAVVGPGGVWGAVARRLLPWGDLVMMRRQLLNLKRLAERGAD